MKPGAFLRAWRPEITMAAAVLVGAGALLGFAAIADEVMEGETRTFDRFVLLALRNPANPAEPIGPAWFAEAMRDLTALGGTTLVTLFVIAATGFLLILRRRQGALLLVLATSSGAVLSDLLKLGFARPRPDLVPHAVEVHSASFPSGHSMMPAIVYLTLGVLLAQTQASRPVKLYLLSLAVALVVVVGVSRVYLGVHYPTDVVAGWIVGLLWASICWLVAQHFETSTGLKAEKQKVV